MVECLEGAAFISFIVGCAIEPLKDTASASIAMSKLKKIWIALFKFKSF